MAERPNGRWFSTDTLWLFVGQAALALFAAGMLYSRFTSIEASAATTNMLIQDNRERILVLEAQFKYITQKLDEIAHDVKALRDKP